MRRRCGARAVHRARQGGETVVLRRGRYGLPAAAADARLAVELNGTISHLSAALAWGWQVKDPPDRPHLTLPRGRYGLPATADAARHRRQAHLHWQDRPPPAVVDSRGVRLAVPLEALVDAVARSSRTGRTRALRVAHAADRRAANPFESCLRAVCGEVRCLAARPQVRIGPYRVDLADPDLGIVIEADSRTWHAGPAEHDADVRRYTHLVRNRWIVVRFSHHDVMHDPAYVAEVLADVVAQAERTRAARLSDRTRASPSPGTRARPRRSPGRRTPRAAAAPRRRAPSR